jgi:hypothetical protein
MLNSVQVTQGLQFIPSAFSLLLGSLVLELTQTCRITGRVRPGLDFRFYFFSLKIFWRAAWPSPFFFTWESTRQKYTHTGCSAYSRYDGPVPFAFKQKILPATFAQ